MVDRGVETTWVVWAYPDRARHSGTYHRTSAEALATRGVRVDVVAPVGLFPVEPLRSHTRRRWPSPTPSDSFTDSGLVRVARPEYFAYPGQVRFGVPHLIMERRIRKIAEPTDLVHAHGAYPWGLAGLRLAKRWGVPFVLTLHGSDVNMYPRQSRLSRARFERLVNGADRVIAVSNALADETENLVGVRPSVIPLGIPIETFQFDNKLQARKTLGLPDDGRIALYVGVLEPFKGVNLLLEAAGWFAEKGVTTLVVGDGSLRREVERCPDVRYLGSQPAESVATAMAASDALVLPSSREGLPTVACEAGASGLTVVASSAGGLTELLADDRGYIIEDLTSRCVFETVYRVLSEPAESSRRARLLKEHVMALYDVSISAARLEEVYRDCIARAGGPSP